MTWHLPTDPREEQELTRKQQLRRHRTRSPFPDEMALDDDDEGRSDRVPDPDADTDQADTPALLGEKWR